MGKAKMRHDHEPVSLLMSCGTKTTEVNRTGSWRFVRPVAAEKTAPCSAACPAGEDIAAVETLAGGGKWIDAAETILMENPFPSVCGRVCFRPCETACNRGRFDEAVAVSQLERFAGDRAERVAPARFTGRSAPLKVAVVGAGPAGLSAAYFLSRLGHRCRVIERSEEPGGLLRWGIPAYRLPRPVLKREIARIEALGVEIRCGAGTDKAGIAALEKENDAVFFACGQSRSIPLRIEGEAHMRDGLRLLADIRRDRAPSPSGTVAVIGGGNTAVDVARCLVRLGAHPVIVYRRRRRDMPAFAPEVAMAVEEGVELRTLQAPVRLSRQDGKIAAVFMDMEPVASGIDGRARVSPVAGSESETVYDAVVSGVGAEADAAFVAAPEARDLGHCRIAFGAPLRLWGGDLTNPVRSVADAVASGKTAALAVDAFFGAGEEGLAQALAECRVGNGPTFSFERYVGGRRSAQRRKIVDFTDLKTDYFLRSGRIAAPVRSPFERAGDFAEVVSGLDSASALQEAQRCFHCGRCDDCDNCRLFCPDMAVAADDGRRRFLLDFCKGCGICVAECPRCALDLAEEP